MENDRFRLLLARKLANEITSAESKELNDLIKNDKLKQLKYDSFVNFTSNKNEQNQSDLDELFKITISKIEDEENKPQREFNQLNVKKTKTSNWIFASVLQSNWKYAAVFFLILLSTFYLIDQSIIDQNKKELVETTDQNFIIKSTEKGQKLSITLPDGSKVKLNANSTLKFRNNFTQNRETFLVGEAFFEVAENPQKPFTVNTKEIVTTALGTSFNIRNFDSEDNVTVMLATGKVVVENLKDSSQTHLLNPTEQLYYNITNKQAIKSKFKKEWIAWKDGTLYFEEADIVEIKNQLERWYGVEVNIKEEIKCSVNGSYTNKSLKHVLEGIEYSAGIAYEIINNEINLEKKN